MKYPYNRELLNFPGNETLYKVYINYGKYIENKNLPCKQKVQYFDKLIRWLLTWLSYTFAFSTFDQFQFWLPLILNFMIETKIDLKFEHYEKKLNENLETKNFDFKIQGSIPKIHRQKLQILNLIEQTLK